MRPTLRGIAVLGVAVGAAAVGTEFGQPGLAAIAGPLLIALLGAAIQVSLSGVPDVERSALRRGFPGDDRTVRLTVGGSGIARLTDRRPDGLGGDATMRCSLPATVESPVSCERRGEYDLGPVSVTVTDTLGLVVTSGTIDATDSVLVYPPVYRLGGPETFDRLVAPAAEDSGGFDRLREYVPGDSLRDIHWKSSAKRDDLLVAEYDDDRDDRDLLVVAQATAGHADAMAAAAASVSVAALQSGFAVELTTPDGTVPSGVGASHRTRLLEALARTGDGQSGREAVADVVVSATDDGVTVGVGDRTHALADLTASRENPLTSGVAT